MVDLVCTQKHPYPKCQVRLKTLNGAVCYSILRDMHPNQTVNYAGPQSMLTLMHSYEPQNTDH